MCFSYKIWYDNFRKFTLKVTNIFSPICNLLPIFIWLLLFIIYSGKFVYHRKIYTNGLKKKNFSPFVSHIAGYPEAMSKTNAPYSEMTQRWFRTPSTVLQIPETSYGLMFINYIIFRWNSRSLRLASTYGVSRFRDETATVLWVKHSYSWVTEVKEKRKGGQDACGRNERRRAVTSRLECAVSTPTFAVLDLYAHTHTYT